MTSEVSWISKQVYSVPAFATPAEYTAQKMKFSIKDFFSKCDQIRKFLRIWSHWLKKSLMENFIFCVVQGTEFSVLYDKTKQRSDWQELFCDKISMFFIFYRFYICFLKQVNRLYKIRRAS